MFMVLLVILAYQLQNQYLSKCWLTLRHVLLMYQYTTFKSGISIGFSAFLRLGKILIRSKQDCTKVVQVQDI
jgi:hypothetical protein